MKYIKKLAIILTIIIAIIIGALYFVPKFIPLDTLQNQIISNIEKSTGLEIVIKDTIKLSFLPSISIKSSNISIKNNNIKTDKNILFIESFKADIKLIPLFYKKIEIKNITLISPKVNLIFYEKNLNNWYATQKKYKNTKLLNEKQLNEKQGNVATKNNSNSLISNTESTESTESKTDKSIIGSEIIIHQIILKNASIAYDNRSTKQKYNINNFNMRFSNNRKNYPSYLKGNLILNKLPINFSIKSTKSINHIINKKQFPFLLAIDSKLFQMNLDTTLLNLNLSPPNLISTISLDIYNIDKLIKLFNSQKPLQITNFKLPKNIKSTASIKIENKIITVSEGIISIDETVIINTNNIIKLNKKPSIISTIIIDKINLDNYLIANKKTQYTPKELKKINEQSKTNFKQGVKLLKPKKMSNKKKLIKWSKNKIDISFLEKININSKLNIYSLIVKNLPITNIELHTNLNNNKLVAELKNASVANGTVAAVMNLHRYYSIIIDGNLRTKNIDLAIINNKFNKNYIKNGLLQFNGNFSAKGNFAYQLVANLTGTTETDINNLQANIIDFKSIIKNPVNKLLSSSMQPKLLKSKNVQINTTIKNGYVHIKEVNTNIKDFNFDLKGNIQIVSEKLDLILEDKSSDSIISQIKIKGTVMNPKPTIDFTTDGISKISNQLQKHLKKKNIKTNDIKKGLEQLNNFF